MSPGFFHAMLGSLSPADREWVISTIKRYTAINERPNSPKARL